MTMEEYLQLSVKEMWEVIKTDPNFRNSPEAAKAFREKAMEESKQWEIEHYGDYAERWYIDPLPRDRVKKDEAVL